MLAPDAGRHAAGFHHAVLLGPAAVARQPEGAHQHVHQRQVDGVVGVHVIGAAGVVPVVVTRQHQHVFQPAKTQAQVGVRDHRLQPHEDDVGVDRGRREAQQHQRQQHHRTGQQDLDQVHARPGQPVQVTAGMVHGMEAPQRSPAVVGAMQQGLGKVGAKHRQQELHPQRQCLDRHLQRREGGQGRHARGPGGDGDQDELDADVADEKIGQVGAPLGPQGRLRDAAEQAFDRNEDQGRKKQRHHEPVQAQRPGAVADLVEADPGATAQHRQRGGADAHQGNAPVAAAQHGQRAQRERGDQADQQQATRKTFRVNLPELPAGQQIGEVETQHAQQARKPQQGGDVGGP